MGLKVGDLEDLVKPVISIDEFKSKIDSDAIVIGFYVNDNEAAEDLSQFIESGMYGILDTEVSPGTDEQGNYMVFVEFLRNDELPEKIQNMLSSIGPLTRNKDWSFTYYGGHDRKIDFSKSNIKKYVRLEEQNQEIEEFFRPSLLDHLEYDNNKLTLGRKSNKLVFEYITIGTDIPFLMEALNIENKPIHFNDNSRQMTRLLENMLGEKWIINKIDDYYLLSHRNTDKVLFLK